MDDKAKALHARFRGKAYRVNAVGHRKTAAREVDLDIVRGVAILLAMGWHINSTFVSSGPARYLFAPGRTIGWAGVDLFFVLSGFLIGGAIIREIKKTGSFDYKRFFVRRIFRLWPILYTFLLAMLVIEPARQFFWQCALHIQNMVHTQSATHLWSLAVEEQFYLLLGLGFPLVFAHFRWERALPICLITVLVGCPLLRMAGAAAGASPTAIQVQTQYRLDALAVGVLISFLAEVRPDTFRRVLGLRTLWAGTLVAATLFIWFVPKDGRLGEIIGYSVSWMAGASFLLLTYRSGFERPLGMFGRAVAFVGQVSYPLYLWHVPMLKLMERLSHKLHLPDEVWAILTYATAIALSAALSKWIEHVFMDIRDRLVPPAVPPIPPSPGETMPML